MQQNEQSFIVLDVQGYINALITAVDIYNQGDRQIRFIDDHSDANNETIVTVDPLPRMDQSRAIRIIHALADENLSQHVHYRTHNSPIYEIAQALRDCAVPVADDILLTENFLCLDTVDGVVLELTRQLGYHISGYPWRQWQLMGTSRMVALIGGKDFRISEWERFHGNEYTQDDEFLRVNITSTVNVIHHSIGQALNLPADHIPVYQMVLDGLRRHCPDFVFQNDHGLYPKMIAAMGVSDYESFYQTFIREPLESFVMMFLHGHLERDNWQLRNEQYNAEFTTDYQLVLTRRSRSATGDELRYRDIRQSVDAGDWLPERDIRWMEEYERLR
jgi:hypothetical protein